MEQNEGGNNGGQQDGAGTVTSIDEAKVVVAELKEQNRILKETLERAEKLEASAILSGRAFAGQKQQPKIETPVEYKDRIMRGEYDA